MKLCSLGLAAMLITSPVYADEAMTVLQDLGSKWQTAYNNGEPAKFADLYTQDAFFSSGVLGTLEGDCRPNQEDPQDHRPPNRSTAEWECGLGPWRVRVRRWTEWKLRDHGRQQRWFVAYRHACF
jgi:hypothetical protein